MPILRAANLRQVYGPQVIFADLDLHLAAGEIVVVLGENGAGKSTLLRTLACELAVAHGSLEIAGVDAAAEPERAARHLIHIAQHPPLAERLSPREHATALIALRQLDEAAGLRALEEVAAALRIGAVLDRPVRALSGGTQHKVALLLGMLAQTPLLLLDEPHAGLDVRSALALRELLRAARDRGAALLVASHLAEATLAIADRALVLARGSFALDLDRATLAAFGGDARRFEAEVLRAMG